MSTPTPMETNAEQLKSEELSKSFSDSSYGLPKSWFNDPYAMLDTMGLGYRTAPTTLTYETLKQMSEKNVVIASILQTRLYQVASFCQPQRNKYSIGYKVQHRDQKRKLTESEKRYIQTLERFVANMGTERDPERDSFENWARKVVRDRLVYDQLCSEKVLRRNGKPASVWAIDAATMRIATSRSKKGTPQSKWESENTPKYVQVIDGQIANEYLRNEFIFRVANPRTDLRTYGYGLSELELLINTVTSHLWAEQWNQKVFSQGSTVKGILNVVGNVPQSQFESFKRQWMTQVSGVTNAWRTPVMNSENLQWIPLQPSNNDMGYQQWLEYLIKVACAVYLIDPSEINFDTRSSAGTQPMFMTTNEAQQKVSKDRGLQPLLRFVQNVVNEDILWEIDENFEFLFMGLDSRTESEAIELRMKELQSYKTLNEVRREADELEPVEGGDTVMNPVYIGHMQAQQQQAAGAGGPGGAPGAAMGGGALGGAVPPPSQKEMFENQFGGGPPGPPEAQLAGRIGKTTKSSDAEDEDETKTDEKDEEHSQEETEDPWETTVHASESRIKKLERRLGRDLRKALNAFDGVA